MNVELFTVATHDTPGFQRLRRSLERFGIPLTVIGWGEEFPGFGWRFKQVVDAIRKQPVRSRFVAHCDAFDTVCLAPIEVLVSRFLDQVAPIVFSCEWEAGLGTEPTLNPGLFIAERDAFMEVFGGDLEELMPHHFNDMNQVQFLWRSNHALFHPDCFNQCFFTQGAGRRLVPLSGRLFDPFCGVAPCFVHGPNGADLSNADRWLEEAARGVGAAGAV